MNRLAIIGAGELGQQVLHYSKIDGRYNIIGFFDDFLSVDKEIHNLPVLGRVSDVIRLYKEGLFDLLFIAIGYKHLDYKNSLYNQLKLAIPFATIIASPVYIDSTAVIGNGVIIYPGCIIDRNVVVEDNVLLNLGVLIAHDSRIGQSVFCAPRVTVSGFSEISSCCFLGTGVIVIDDVKIHPSIRIGAGSVVVSNLNLPGTYLGIPSKQIK